MRWLFRILILCVILGGWQWMHTHPDADTTKQLHEFFHQVQLEWDNFTGTFSDYWHSFPQYMRNLLDTAPKTLQHP